ncbi:Ring finger domain [Trypanosoma vivax]|uniref:RING-type domain-containing protein n=1 Tax=Trypanosoma vivax (strain Y486) TaxID=1055687 RepID=G0U9Z4_TRYVY|nr:hypothetical protein TRVL_01010 [Trypanosoma vivax]KAH8618992.1 Ring finger domain [Trypanosoma vivax]CCC52625.1 conserved hypothetical protein [Trypanosoma vivax Y486]
MGQEYEEQSTAESNVCGVCFTSIHFTDNPRGRLNSCEHIFCAHCIVEWSRNTNVCPHCKARFTRIVVQRSDGSEVVTKVRKRNYKLWQESDESEEYEDTALLDDGEEAVAHLTRVQVASRIKCNICFQEENAVRMILCDRRECQYMVHLDCIGLSERPAEFYCSDCTVLRGRGEAVPLAGQVTGVMEKCKGTNEPRSNQCRSNSLALRAAPPSAVGSQKIPAAPPSLLRRHTLMCQGSSRSEKTIQSLPTVSSSWMVGSGNGENCDSTIDCRASSKDEVVDRYAQEAMQQYIKRIEQREHHRSLAPLQSLPIPKVGTSSPVAVRSNGMKRTADSLRHQEQELPTAALLDPAIRLKEEERIAKRVALDMLPTLRRHRSIQENRLLLDSNGDVVVSKPHSQQWIEQREEELWQKAITEGRRVAQERIKAILGAMRHKRERRLAIRAQREAAALAKLASLIASRRLPPET